MPSNDPHISSRLTDSKDLPLFVKWLMQKDVLIGFPMCDRREVEDAVSLWTTYIEKGVSLTALYDGQPVGAANLYIQEVEKLSHQALFVIIVDEAYRGRGIGTFLLHEIQALGKKRGVEILHLEVYDKNPAVRLYEKLGFKKYGSHPHYLRDGEGNYYDKIFMQMLLT